MTHFQLTDKLCFLRHRSSPKSRSRAGSSKDIDRSDFGGSGVHNFGNPGVHLAMESDPPNDISISPSTNLDFDFDVEIENLNMDMHAGSATYTVGEQDAWITQLFDDTKVDVPPAPLPDLADGIWSMGSHRCNGELENFGFESCLSPEKELDAKMKGSRTSSPEIDGGKADNFDLPGLILGRGIESISGTSSGSGSDTDSPSPRASLDFDNFVRIKGMESGHVRTGESGENARAGFMGEKGAGEADLGLSAKQSISEGNSVGEIKAQIDVKKEGKKKGLKVEEHESRTSSGESGIVITGEVGGTGRGGNVKGVGGIGEGIGGEIKSGMTANKACVTKRKRKVESQVGMVKEELRTSDGEGGCGGESEISGGRDGCEPEEYEVQKRQARLMRNRESAQLSRQRKKYYMDELEGQLRTMAATVAELNATIAHLTAENVNLRRQMAFYFSASGGGGTGTQIPGGVAPLVPGSIPPVGVMGSCYVSYLPGMPAPPVPIPKLKTTCGLSSGSQGKKKPVLAQKPSSNPQGGDISRSQKKTKKSTPKAPVAALALFCLVMVVGPFWPMDGGIGASSSWFGVGRRKANEGGFENTEEVERYGDERVRGGGRVLMAAEEREWVNSSRIEEMDPRGSGERIQIRAGKSLEFLGKKLWNAGVKDVRQSGCLTEGVTNKTVAAVPIAATVELKRGDEMIRIDGSLIIQAVMAGNQAAIRVGKERALVKMARGPVGGAQEVPLLPKTPENVQGDEKKVIELKKLKAMALLAMGGDASLHKKQSKAPINALLPGRHTKTIDDGTASGTWLPKGSFLSSETCVELFQFDTSPSNPSPSSTPLNKTYSPGHHEGPLPPTNPKPQIASNNETLNERRTLHRRFGVRGSSYAVPLPPVSGGGVKVTEESKKGFRNHVGTKISEAENISYINPVEEQSSSSIVVSLLANPEEDVDGTSELPRVFVVVLVDGVRYVTYSCTLPTLKKDRLKSIVAT